MVAGRRNGLYQVNPLEDVCWYGPPLTHCSHHGSHVCKAGHPRLATIPKATATHSGHNCCTIVYKVLAAQARVVEYRLIEWLHEFLSRWRVIRQHCIWQRQPTRATQA